MITVEWIGALVEPPNLWTYGVVSSIVIVTTALFSNGLGQAATTYEHPLDPGDEWVPGLGQ